MASTTNKSSNTRFLDASEEPNQVLLPIRGYANEPLLSIDDAVRPIFDLLNDLDLMVDTAKQNSKKPADGLTPNESAAIHLYTMQWEEPNVSLYTILNKILRSARRESLKPWFRYLKLILTALFKLPSLRGTVWRGVRGNLSDQYDEDHVWWGFSSCTESVDAMEQFVGRSGTRTLFNIECINGKAIRAHSFYKTENEILLLPGTHFRVVGKWSPVKDLYIIHLRETPAPRQYLEPPFESTPMDRSVSTASASIHDPSTFNQGNVINASATPAHPTSSSQSKLSNNLSPVKHFICQYSGCNNRCDPDHHPDGKSTCPGVFDSLYVDGGHIGDNLLYVRKCENCNRGGFGVHDYYGTDRCKCCKCGHIYCDKCCIK